MTRKLLDTRTIFGIGSGRADIFGIEGGTFVVEVTCNKGVTSVEVADSGEAWHTFMHPFDREGRMSIPGTVEQGFSRPLTDEEYALFEALDEVEADSSDAISA